MGNTVFDGERVFHFSQNRDGNPVINVEQKLVPYETDKTTLVMETQGGKWFVQYSSRDKGTCDSLRHFKSGTSRITIGSEADDVLAQVTNLVGKLNTLNKDN